MRTLSAAVASLQLITFICMYSTYARDLQHVGFAVVDARLIGLVSKRGKTSCLWGQTRPATGTAYCVWQLIYSCCRTQNGKWHRVSHNRCLCCGCSFGFCARSSPCIAGTLVDVYADGDRARRDETRRNETRRETRERVV